MSIKPVTALAGLILFSFWIPQAKAQCSKEAQDVVAQFFQFDFEGYRLSSDGHRDIWKLTDGEGEPPAIPMVVTKGFKILSAKEGNKGTCIIRVGFNTYGSIDEEINFDNKPSIEEWTVLVQRIKGKPRIKLSYDDFKVSPHPGKEAVLKWADDLLENEKARKDVRAVRDKILSLK